jgi:hypothetical protein
VDSCNVTLSFLVYDLKDSDIRISQNNSKK